MTRRRTRSSVLTRSARSFAALTAVLAWAALLTPVANASPIGDADNAITAAWKEAGGDTSDLGDKQGECYVAGAGFAQDFVHGKMFFTPATGPRSMMGAILDKYEGLGGPAASDLGFPLTNEVRGLAGPDSRVSTFSATDKPLIYWTADHGAFVVRGAINAAWDKLGSSSGVLGVPTGDETYDGELASQAFSGGKLSWNRLSKAFTTVPADLAGQLTGLQIPVDPTAEINMAWRAAGGVSGPLGAKQGDQYGVGGDGLAQNFTGGKVFFSPATGANAVESEILAKYDALGGPVKSGLGYPVSNEIDGGVKPSSKVSAFSAADKPVIFWTPDHGAYVVRGAIRSAWDKLLGATGKLGAPLGDQTVANGVITQKFSGGQIAWNQAKNTFTTEPANLASALSGLQVPGQKNPAGPASLNRGESWLSAHWLWLVAGTAAVVLIVLLALLARLWGRRRVARRDVAIDSSDTDFEAPTESVTHWSPTADRERASSGLAQDYPPPRPRTVRLPSQSSSAWMPPGRSLADELLEADEPEEFSAFGEFDHGDHDERYDHDERVDHDDDERYVEDEQVEQGNDEHYDDEHYDDEDPDDVDTDPTGIPVSMDAPTGRHAAAHSAHDEDSQVTEAVPIPRITPGQLAIHLPMDDPYQVPDGYPVKANASSGLYYMPDSGLYDDTQAEIWFASEEVARANGFHKAG